MSKRRKMLRGESDTRRAEGIVPWQVHHQVEDAPLQRAVCRSKVSWALAKKFNLGYHHEGGSRLCVCIYIYTCIYLYTCTIYPDYDYGNINY